MPFRFSSAWRDDNTKIVPRLAGAGCMRRIMRLVASLAKIGCEQIDPAVDSWMLVMKSIHEFSFMSFCDISFLCSHMDTSTSTMSGPL